MWPAPAAWARIRALGVCLIVTLSLAIAPALVTTKHGPDVIAVVTDRHADYAEHGHAHRMAGSHQHESGDHDHVGVVPLGSTGAEISLRPERTFRPEWLFAHGTIREGPRRPPRLTLI